MIFKTFSKRKKAEFGVNDDIYAYDEIPKKLRNQISHIWTDSIGECRDAWNAIHDIMVRELGLLEIVSEKYYGKKEGCILFLLDHDVTDEVIDIIEVSFNVIEQLHSNLLPYDKQYNKINQNSDEAIKELNHRFKENNIGYEYIDGEIIRIDRELTHVEIIKPAIKFLSELEFEGVNDEFMEAHKDYREGDYKSAINNAQKSFESMMKTICKKMGYTYDKDKDSAKILINRLIDESFIPKHLSNHFDGLRSCLNGIKTSLESGLPTLRNRESGHGQGESIVGVPEYLAIYAINLVATNIVLLADIYTYDYKK
ncbi:hypothetical protein NE452_01835 [Paeniclostridium sordellii]|uniref:STM4504/CBY_0614 family protein n=1 Tax=Paraclostridium sordellii TaxID=1505 RepID=UPI002109AFDF|nr:hypothetical protein [Paeniclostridium sordellii]MCQ4696250.1 hypothetical protein [Paeniclostridium sordellii]